MLKLNIEAAERNNWTTKLAVFKRLQKLCDDYSKSGTSTRSDAGKDGRMTASTSTLAAAATARAKTGDEMTSDFGNGTISRGKLHTPVFESNVQIEVLGDGNEGEEGEGRKGGGSFVEEGRLDAAVTHKSSCVDGSKVTAALGLGTSNASKTKTKSKKRKVGTMSACGEHDRYTKNAQQLTHLRSLLVGNSCREGVAEGQESVKKARLRREGKMQLKILPLYFGHMGGLCVITSLVRRKSSSCEVS